MDGGQNPTPATTTPEPPTPITTPLPIPTPGPGDAARVRSGRAGAVGPSPETARRKDEDLIPTTTAPSMAGPDIEVLRQSAWLWSHPDVLAAALTDNPRGQAYLGGILPDLQPSPTGRAVVEALLAHGKVNVDILPPELRALNGSVQPWVPSIYIYDMNQPETTFAHEALHLLQRLSGVDPRNIAGEVVVQVRVPGRDPAKFWGDELGVRYRPGFSLAMEREAYAIDLTIQFELAEVAIRVAPNDPNLQKKVNDRSDEVRRLTMQGPAAAFREVLAQGRPNHAPTGASIYDPFAEGNNPPRDWRQDLARMRLAAVVPHVERAAQHAAPPGAKRPPQPAISARSPQAPTTPPTPRTGPPRQRAK